MCRDEKKENKIWYGELYVVRHPGRLLDVPSIEKMCHFAMSETSCCLVAIRCHYHDPESPSPKAGEPQVLHFQDQFRDRQR